MTIKIESMQAVTPSGLTVNVPQDRIFFEGRHVGYCCHKPGSPLNLIVCDLSESAKCQIQKALNDRDGVEYRVMQRKYSRVVSEVPPMEIKKDE